MNPTDVITITIATSDANNVDVSIISDFINFIEQF